MWRWVLKAAVAVARTEWAKRKAAELIEKIRRKAEKDAKAVADAAGLDSNA